MQILKHFSRNPALDFGDLPLWGYGSEERKEPGIIDRPYRNEGVVIVHFHDATIVRDRYGIIPRAPNSGIAWTSLHSQYFGNPTNAWTHSWFWGDSVLMEAEWSRAGLPWNEVISMPSPDIHRKYLRLIDDEASRQPAPDAEILKNFLRNWIREVARSAQGDHLQAPRVLLDAKRRIETQFSTVLTLEDLACHTDLAVSYFCREFKHHFGVSPIAYLIRVRLEHAALLLRDRNLGIGQIGHMVGYGDLYQFSKAFRKHHGVSPRALRTGLSQLAE